jgi:hypothetical protein
VIFNFGLGSHWVVQFKRNQYETQRLQSNVLTHVMLRVLFEGAAIATQFFLPLVYCYNLEIKGEHRFVPLGLRGFEKDLKGCWRIRWLARHWIA